MLNQIYQNMKDKIIFIYNAKSGLYAEGNRVSHH